MGRSQVCLDSAELQSVQIGNNWLQMSLLEQLALYSCKFDSLFPELFSLASSHPTANALPFPTHNRSTRSIKTSSSAYSPDKQPIKSGGCKQSLDGGFAEVVEKYARVNGMASMVENKVRKLKYEFVIYLSNYRKKGPDGQNHAGLIKSDVAIERNQADDLKCVRMAELFKYFQTKIYSQVEAAFKLIRKAGHLSINDINKRQLNNWHQASNRQQILQLMEIRPAKCIQLATALQTENRLSFQSGFENLALSEEKKSLSIKTQNFVYAKQQQSPDLPDYINIFIAEAFSRISTGKKKPVLKKTLIQQSWSSKAEETGFSQPFSELQFTAISPSPRNPRRPSQLTTFSKIFSKSLQACEEGNEKSEFAGKSSLKEVKNQMQVAGMCKQEQKPQVSDISLSAVQSLQELTPAQNSGKRRKRGSQGTAKAGIEQQDCKQFAKYLQFKKAIDRRKEYTIREIQNSQLLIAQLIESFKASRKEEGNSQKRQMNRRRKPQRKINTQSIRKASSARKSTNKDTPKMHLSSLIDQKNIPTDRNTLFTERIDLVSQQTSLKTIEVYCNYVKEKQKMKCQQFPAKKEKIQAITKQRAAKQDTNKNQIKEIFQIYKNQKKREPRLEVRVELAKNKPAEGTKKAAVRKEQNRSNTKRKIPKL